MCIRDSFMTRVFNRERTFLDPVLRPIERLIYRVTGVDEAHEMKWTEYTVAMLLFSCVSMLVLYVMMRVQGHLPFNPQKFGSVDPATLRLIPPRHSRRTPTGKPTPAKR